MDPIISAVIKLIDDQVKNCKQKLNYIVLVGGFGDSKLLQQTILTRNSTTKIYCPNDPVLAVVKGAVYLGIDRVAIKSRKSAFTCIQYLLVSVSRLLWKIDGVRVIEPWDVSKHDENKLIQDKGDFFCKDVFFPFITVGQEKGTTLLFVLC